MAAFSVHSPRIRFCQHVVVRGTNIEEGIQLWEEAMTRMTQVLNSKIANTSYVPTIAAWTPQCQAHTSTFCFSTTIWADSSQHDLLASQLNTPYLLVCGADLHTHDNTVAFSSCYCLLVLWM